MDLLPLGGDIIDLHKIEAIRLDQPWGGSKPGKCHRVYFSVGPSKYEDRALEIDVESQEGHALRRWARGLDGEPETIQMPPKVDPATRPVIGPSRPCCRTEAALSAAWEPGQGVAEASTDPSSLGRGA